MEGAIPLFGDGAPPVHRQIKFRNPNGGWHARKTLLRDAAALASDLEKIGYEAIKIDWVVSGSRRRPGLPVIAKETTMSGWVNAVMTIAACALATPVAGQAPTTAFDGKYAGVSRESLKSGAAAAAAAGGGGANVRRPGYRLR
jgi:hypothetical protein